jgi:hypothetical protein
MVRNAERRRRRKRQAVAAVLVLALGIAAIMGTLWQRSVSEARRAEASKLLALGELELEDNPTTALAFAMASLELADTPEVRLGIFLVRRTIANAMRSRSGPPADTSLAAIGWRRGIAGTCAFGIWRPAFLMSSTSVRMLRLSISSCSLRKVVFWYVAVKAYAFGTWKKAQTNLSRVSKNAGG